MASRTDLKIPYGVADFKTIRNEGFYYVDKTMFLAKPEMERARGYCDFCLFPERVYNGDVRDSYIIELKYSKPGASEAEIAAKAQEGIDQLRRYAADPFVPALAAGTRLHCLLYQFQGAALLRAEEIDL